MLFSSQIEPGYPVVNGGCGSELWISDDIPYMGAMGHGPWNYNQSFPNHIKKSWLFSFWWLIDDY